MNAPLIGDLEVIVTMKFATPPGTTPEKASGVANGINIPVTLVQYIKSTDVQVIPIGGGPKLV